MTTITITHRGTPMIVDAAALAAHRAMTEQQLRAARINANGSRAMATLTICEYVAEERAAASRAASNLRTLHGASPGDIARRGTPAARAYDAINNEGGEGYNPHRNGR